jgi:hypothetical protein
MPTEWYHLAGEKPLWGAFFRSYEAILRLWRSPGDSNPCFRRERGNTRS